MNEMSKPIPKPPSVFPEGVGNKARWTRYGTIEHLDDEMKTSSIINLLMQNLCDQANEPSFSESDTGLINHVSELINWLLEEQRARGSKLRAEIAELEKEAQA
jgi:hypothetical protein